MIIQPILSGGGYDQEDADEARAIWMKNTACFKNGTYYSRLYSVGSTKYRLIFLDNSIFGERYHDYEQEFVIDKPQLDWLESQLNESSTDYEIIFMHMSLPYSKANESYKEYVKRTKTKEFLDIMTQTKNSSVRAIVAGHEHINQVHKFEFPQEQSFTQILSGDPASNTVDWRLFELTESDIVIYEQGSTDKKTMIPLK